MYFSTYNAAPSSSYMTSDPSMYRWQPPNNNINITSSHTTTTFPSLPSTPSSTDLPGHKNNNLSLSDRLAYVEALVDMNAMVIEAIWPTTVAPNGTVNTGIVPLRSFIQEVLKRSRTTYSTLQTAFFYLFRARPAIVHYLRTSSVTRHTGPDQNTIPLSGRDAYIHCGRRMFLASLVVASKYVQDKTYRNSVWAKIAGLTVQEINASERVFLELLDYRLYVAQPTFDQWHQLLHTHVQAKTSSTKYGISPGSFTDNNDKSTVHSPSSADSPAYITTPSSSPSKQKNPYPISTPSSLASPMNSTNDSFLPSIRSQLCILPTSSTTTTPSSSIPALSPSSIASTSSSTCSPILVNNPSPLNVTTASGGKRRLLNDQDTIPYLHQRSINFQQQKRKRPCNTWPTPLSSSSSSSSSSNSC